MASLLVFFFSSLLLILSILLKTQWFRYLPGWILASYIGGFVVTGIYLLGRWLGWLPASWQVPFYTAVFGGFALINIVNGGLLWVRNRGYWAWSK